jgi:hypothetical protein
MAETRESREDLHDLKKAVEAEYYAADDFQQQLARDRIQLTRAYECQPLGNEQEGRSKIVMSDVRDVINALLPSLMRVFFGFARPVEFVPTSPDPLKVAEAEQATDYVDYVLKYDNPGFLEFYRWFKDALIRRIGIMKVWWDEKQHVEAVTIEQPDEQATVAIAAEAALDPGIEVEVEKDCITVRKRNHTAGARIRCVPPEEFLFSSDAVNLEDARYVAHRTVMTASDLLSMGYPEDVVLEEASGNADPRTTFGQEWFERFGSFSTTMPSRDDIAGRLVLVVEHYIRFDADDDGVAELHRVITVGNRMEIVSDEIVDEIPFVVITPDPEPHQLIGLSIAERVMDLQKARTMLVRGLLDSLALTVNPRFGVVEGHASLADVLNTEIGAPIRMDAPGMVVPLAVPFVGRDALPVLQYLDEMKENRTGISKAAVGLDPDSLQSATKTAVEATVRGAQEHVELIARVFAEIGVAPLYRKVYHLITRNQEKPRVVKLRGRWVEVSPFRWTSDLNVVVRVGVGEGTLKERVELLQGLANKVENILQLMGPNNMLVRPSNYRNLLAKILELNGIYNVNDFFQQIDPKLEAEALAAASQTEEDPQKEAARTLAQVQVEQIKADIAMKEAELNLREKELMMKYEMELTKLKQEYALKMRELELRYNQPKQEVTP